MLHHHTPLDFLLTPVTELSPRVGGKVGGEEGGGGLLIKTAPLLSGSCDLPGRIVQHWFSSISQALWQSEATPSLSQRLKFPSDKPDLSNLSHAGSTHHTPVHDFSWQAKPWKGVVFTLHHWADKMEGCDIHTAPLGRQDGRGWYSHCTTGQTRWKGVVFTLRHWADKMEGGGIHTAPLGGQDGRGWYSLHHWADKMEGGDIHTAPLGRQDGRVWYSHCTTGQTRWKGVVFTLRHWADKMEGGGIHCTTGQTRC